MRVVVTKKLFGVRWYLRIVAGNGETVAVSQRYTSKSNAVRAARDLVDSANSEQWLFILDFSHG